MSINGAIHVSYNKIFIKTMLGNFGRQIVVIRYLEYAAVLSLQKSASQPWEGWSELHNA